MLQSSEVGDQFGSALAAGDFNADRRQDLAIGTLESGTSAQHEMGSFFVLPGTPGELNPGAATMTSWMGEKDARVGAALATGDVTADGRDDRPGGLDRANRNTRRARPRAAGFGGYRPNGSVRNAPAERCCREGAQRAPARCRAAKAEGEPT
jgi:hypothetical protein